MRKEDSEVILKEAEYFYEFKIAGETVDASLIHDVKTKIKDFYSFESKAYFLNSILYMINNNLNQYIQSDGFAKKPNHYHLEQQQKLLFYIQQEIDTLPLFDISQHLDKVLAKAKKENHKFPENRNKVFICYNRNDSGYKNEIKKHFKPFLPKGIVWCDDDINASEVWNEKIKQAISETKVAIFLVSTDFLASDFVMDKEVPAILKEVEKGYTFPLFIILKPCSFIDIPRLNKYQTVNPPTQEVSRMDENEKAALFVNLVRLTMEILDYGKE